MEKEELESAVSLAESDTEILDIPEYDLDIDGPQDMSVNTLNPISSVDGTIESIDELEQANNEFITYTDTETGATQQMEELSIIDSSDAGTIEPNINPRIHTAEYLNLFSRVAEWFTTDGAEQQAPDLDEPEQININNPEIEELLEDSPETNTDHITQRIEEQYEQELTRIEEQVGSDTLQPDLLEALKEIQQTSVQEILKAQNEQEFLSEEDIQQLQSNLITSSLLAFQEQLETERRVAEERVALERQIEFDKQRRKEEREREQQEQQHLEAQRQEERQQQAQQRQEELEAQHKKTVAIDY